MRRSLLLVCLFVLIGALGVRAQSQADIDAKWKEHPPAWTDLECHGFKAHLQANKLDRSEVYRTIVFYCGAGPHTILVQADNLTGRVVYVVCHQIDAVADYDGFDSNTFRWFARCNVPATGSHQLKFLPPPRD